MRNVRYVNPFAVWTDVLLKSSKAALDSLQESAERRRPKVAIVPTPDAPQPAVRQQPRRRPKPKAKAGSKRKAPARSGKARARRR